MRREFPRTPSCLYRKDPVTPCDDRYACEDHDRGARGARPGYEANETGSVQYVTCCLQTPTLLKYGTAKFAKKLMGDCEVEAILQRLDRLTHEEARVTVAHTLDVVHGLVNNLKVVMDGMQTALC